MRQSWIGFRYEDKQLELRIRRVMEDWDFVEFAKTCGVTRGINRLTSDF
jgi:hypothetical protein